MKCPKCSCSNRETAKFCNDCGYRFTIFCPNCAFETNSTKRICDNCGVNLTTYTSSEAGNDVVSSLSERKQVTVMFSDLSGYTSLCEKCDPEITKKITNNVFSIANKIICNYGGFVEKYIGDAILAIFGADKSHEDDPVRAIHAAREINEAVRAINPEIEKFTDCKLSMHSGVNTGVVVTGEIIHEKGTHGISGDTINVAARLCNIGQPNEILVGATTYNLTKTHFSFDKLKPQNLKGKSFPVETYKFLSSIQKPIKVHRISGNEAEIIGRESELDKLAHASFELTNGKGSLVAVIGDAGTGKSRLLKEFREFIRSYNIQWIEGNSYSYKKKIPYSLLIDLITHSFQIREGDSPKRIKLKINLGLNELLGKNNKESRYIESLYSLYDEELEIVSPEYWKSELHRSIENILKALIARRPTIFCFEDLHWADPSSIELIRRMSSEYCRESMIICSYRTPFTLFSNDELSHFQKHYIEILTEDLSFDNVLKMLKSLLKTEQIPKILIQHIGENLDGNPFYIEEVVNTLIDNEILIQKGNKWKIIKSLDDADIPSSINGVLTARLDRLEQRVKRIIQEAAVIGRKFLLIILKRITFGFDNISDPIDELTEADLIRLYQNQPDLEYIFKHAMTQEVAYKSLLKEERRDIHEKIGETIEQLFENRLFEFYEVLSFHFKHGLSEIKALDYLIKSGEKSLKRYSLVESDNYFREAYSILNAKQTLSEEESYLLVNLIMKWALVYYYKGNAKGLNELIQSHETTVKSLNEKSMLGMYYAWLGFSYYNREKLSLAENFLTKALKIGEANYEEKVIGYACTWLTFVKGDLGLFEEALNNANRALKIAQSIDSDHYLYFKPLGGIIQVYYYTGDAFKAKDSGVSCLKIGKKYSNVRAMTLGYIGIAISHVLRGDNPSAIETLKKAHSVSADPLYTQIVNLLFGLCYLQTKNFEKSRNALQEVIHFSKENGCEWAETPAKLFMGVVLVSTGKMSQGSRMIEKARLDFENNNKRPYLVIVEYILGKIYLQMVDRNESINLSTILKNIGFLLRNLPFAAQKAEQHFLKAVEMAKEIGASGMLGQIYLDLGLLYKMRRKTEKAKNAISLSIRLLEKSRADFFLEQANEAIKAIK